jgi:transposase
VNLRALVVYLIIYQHVPVERCVRLIADLTGGTGPSAGFVHGMLARCAAVLGEVVALIKTAVIAAAVAGFDETTIRCGPAGQKKYILSGSTETAVAYHLGGRDLGSFAAFGILPAFAGIAVHDRYACYFHPGWENIAGHQACCAPPARSEPPPKKRRPPGPPWRRHPKRSSWSGSQPIGTTR